MTELMLEAGDELTEGSVNPHDILRIKGSSCSSGLHDPGSTESIPSAGC